MRRKAAAMHAAAATEPASCGPEGAVQVAGTGQQELREHDRREEPAEDPEEPAVAQGAVEGTADADNELGGDADGGLEGELPTFVELDPAVRLIHDDDFSVCDHFPCHRGTVAHCFVCHRSEYEPCVHLHEYAAGLDFDC
jgi:hypothetical protein